MHDKSSLATSIYGDCVTLKQMPLTFGRHRQSSGDSSYDEGIGDIVLDIHESVLLVSEARLSGKGKRHVTIAMC